jgi:hypothetical protein
MLVYIIGRNSGADQTPNAPERSSVSALAASDAVSLSFWGHDVESTCAKIGRQARRLVQGVVGQNWRTLPL